MSKTPKIGILTLHSGINHGAFLQAYALQKFLDKNGVNNIIINYKNWNRTIREYKNFILVGNPKLLLGNIWKIIKFKIAHKRLKKTVLIRNSKKVRDINFSLVIIGSDQVWNFKNTLTGLDYLYFGEGLGSFRIISYAASFGPVDEKDVHQKKIFDCIRSNFDQISVRDQNSYNIVKKANRGDVVKMLDPTFLYKFSGEEQLIHGEEKDFLLLYATKISPKRKKEIIEFSRKRNLKIIAISYYHKWADANVVALDPFEWIGYFKKANFIVTSCFHGVAFSLKYQKQFCSFNLEKKDYRIESILDDLKISDRFSKTSEVGEILDLPINYKEVNVLLNQEISKSKQFILSNISQ